ncbi:MAG: 50S ribosomal protein L16 [Leptospiraceae bacterium]|nr:50S ribosomal protein L16 [Leptospiraceae bacterium]MCB1202042.1 50S ribosomal protein L16 [Leptospiraceae bacterium]
MLTPKRLKYRKPHTGNLKGNSKGGNEVSFGELGLKAMSAERITSRQIEAARVAMMRHVKRGAKVWIRIFPDRPVTKKPAETRMGKGKGGVEYYVAIVKPGKVMFEMGGANEALMTEALRLAASKLPIKTRIVKRMTS